MIAACCSSIDPDARNTGPTAAKASARNCVLFCYPRALYEQQQEGLIPATGTAKNNTVCPQSPLGVLKNCGAQKKFFLTLLLAIRITQIL
jgi:hypothetical protein